MSVVRHIGIILFDDFEELDAVGPLEVFGVSDKLAIATSSDGDENISDEDHVSSNIRHQVITVAVPNNPGGRQVRGAHGMCVTTDYAANDPHLPHLDIVLVPGGQGTRKLWKDRATTDWLAGVCEGATWVTSVCTGVLLLHAAGRVTGKRVATHYLFEDQLEALGEVTVVRHKRWVVDGALVTSQGVSAGIDMSLWLVGQLHSPEHARATQKHLQYDPAPPYQVEGGGGSSGQPGDSATVHGKGS